MAELIVTEKPKSALRIAEALSTGKPKKEALNGIPYYHFKRDGSEIYVASAVGHVFGLTEKKEKKGWTYPIFSVEWRPLHEANRKSDHTKKYIAALKTLGKKAEKFTVATDYDVEGEVIGLNIVRHLFKLKDARRMKFSTLTKPDLEKAYAEAMPHLDWGQAHAGETRHELDWYWGINLSRALTHAVKSTGSFKLLSAGRVQGPSLKLIVDKEKEIQKFVAIPYWEIEAKLDSSGAQFSAWHAKGQIFDEKEARERHLASSQGIASVKSISSEEFVQKAPTPFDLTTLQMEAFRWLGIKPSVALEMAQDLYTSGFISYPRTSSQQLPSSLGLREIMAAMSRQERYSALCNELLGKGELLPNNGKKTDPAHPAIYPTGIAPHGKLEPRKARLYDLIAKRFLATFADDARRKSQTVSLDIGKEPFTAKGIVTTYPGWHRFYAPYVKLKDEELPPLKEGQQVDVQDVLLHDLETKPPKRYTQASIIKELEKKNLGTKATRASIIETLSDRGYIQGTSIEATELGMRLIETLEVNCGKIIDEELTRHFEVELDEIREDTKKPSQVLAEAREVLTNILLDFKTKEKDIGKELLHAHRKSEQIARTIGKCVVCGEGTLMMKFGKFGRFIACSRYPDCKTTFKLPANGYIKPTDKVCSECNHPMVLSIRKNKQPQALCINLDCPSKKVPEGVTEGKCPKCQEGDLILRKSIYGAFVGCSRFPKCRYISRIEKKETS